jgi:hypothetical protein
LINKDHPYFFVEKLKEKKNIIFQLSKYIYKPDSLFDERECIDIVSDNFSENYIAKLINSLNCDQELAIHSKVLVNGRLMHIPMIDFSIEDSLTADTIYRLKKLLPINIFKNMAFYDSGRSLHAYSTTLISPKQWVEFMGRLLLVNKRDLEIIDNRWVGHRLLGGYSSLRWSNNSGQYLCAPRIIKSITS